MTTATPARPRPSWSSALALFGFLSVCFAVSGIGGAVTATSVGTWYQGLVKPAFTPPDWVFGPVWTLLYLLMAIAGWLVWRRAGWRNGRAALTLFAAQLALNLAWSVLFFGLRWIGGALVEIVLLWILIAATTVAFWRIDRRAGAFLMPYLLWVAYAGALNGAIWILNRT